MVGLLLDSYEKGEKVDDELSTNRQKKLMLRLATSRDKSHFNNNGQIARRHSLSVDNGPYD